MKTPSNRRWSPFLAAILAGVLATGTIAASVQPSPVLLAATDDVCEGATPDAFRDVPTTNNHVANIDCIASFGVVVGVGGGNYDPNGDVTRGQMASFLVRFVELARAEESSAPRAVAFTDIAGTTHAANIAIAADLGITRGLLPGTYGPRQAVTRQQMASFVADAIQAAGGTLPAGPADAFADDDGSTHESNIDLLAAVDIVSGIGGGNYAPTAAVSRAQMATFLANSIRLLHEQGVWGADPFLEPAPSAPRDPDVATVKRATSDRDDQLDVVWDTSITLTGSFADLAVYAATTDSLVAAATALTAVNGDTFRITLNGDLQGGTTYRLRAEADVAENGAGVSNDSQYVAFFFSASGRTVAPELSSITVDGGAVAAGGAISTDETAPVVSGTAAAPGQTVEMVQYRIAGGTWADATAGDSAYDAESEGFQATLSGLALGTHAVELRARGVDGALSSVYAFSLTIEAIPPTIESVVTDPMANSLVVTFSAPVTCPTGINALLGWSFSNAGVDGASTPSSPASVLQAEQPSSTCLLKYPAESLAAGDYGLLDYAQPGTDGDAVVAASGVKLESVMGEIVDSGTRPAFVSLVASDVQDQLTLEFSEPVRCSSLQAEDFEISVKSVMVDSSDVTDFSCDSVDSAPNLLLSPTVLSDGASVAVQLVGTVLDQSGRNTAIIPKTLLTTAS